MTRLFHFKNEARLEEYNSLLSQINDELGVQHKISSTCGKPQLHRISFIKQQLQYIRDAKANLNIETKTVLWRWLKENKLCFPSDMLDYVRPDHRIVIYSWDNKNLWCSMSFLQTVNCSYQDLIENSWYNLFIRPPEKTKQMNNRKEIAGAFFLKQPLIFDCYDEYELHGVTSKSFAERGYGLTRNYIPWGFIWFDQFLGYK
ncbi:MAG: hypothetical protein ACXVCY_04425 [Pseudobdellovibrionaceae bacterium]